MSEEEEKKRALRAKIVALTGALKSRDARIRKMRARLHLLLECVEEQNNVISDIQQTVTQGSGLKSEETGSGGSPPKEPAPPSDAAQGLLQGHLSSMGFTSGQVNAALEDLADVRSSGVVGDEKKDSATNSEAVGQDSPTQEAQPNNSEAVPKSAILSDVPALFAGSQSVSSLFAGVKDVGDMEEPMSPLYTSEVGTDGVGTVGKGGEKLEAEMNYNGFLERLRRPGSRDLVEFIRRFINSVLGPKRDGEPPLPEEEDEGFEFLGTENLPQRVKEFLGSMANAMDTHPAWRYASEATLSIARNGLEHYVMNKLHCVAFECGEEEDEAQRQFDRRCRHLQFILPEHLDINPAMHNEVVWSIAGDELRKINQVSAPGDKVNCIVKCCSVIFSVLNLARGSDNDSRAGADEFLPVFIYVVLSARVKDLHINCVYISKFRNPAELMSKAGYCFINLRSAIEFILNVDAGMISIDPEVFARHLEEASTTEGVEGGSIDN